MKFLDYYKGKINELEDNISEYLSTLYNNVNSFFTNASPFGQILHVITSYVKLIFLYIEDIVTENNILTANKQKSIYGLSRLSGHNPTRSISATGTLKIKLKQDAIYNIQSPYISILNETRLKCNNNNLEYYLKLDDTFNDIKINTSDSDYIYFKVYQGVINRQYIIGNGEELQSFTILDKAPIGEDNIEIKINGTPCTIVDSLYDMNKDEKSCIVKTSITDGIDIYFGNKDFGYIPKLGEEIEIKYILNSGPSGNILSTSSTIEFEFIDSGYDNLGEEIDLNDTFNIEVDKQFSLGAYSEDIELTKLIAPKMSKSLVLANPDNYLHLLSKFDYSYINAYNTFDDDYLDDDNIIYLFLIPNIKNRIDKNTDYFNLDIDKFKLTEDEKYNLYNYIQQSKKQIVTTELSVVEPILRKYTLNIFLRIFNNYDENTIKNNIIEKISEYFLTINRRDKIPKSDLIALIENVKGVDSVNLFFISEENEKAILNGYYYKTIEIEDKTRGIKTTKQEKITISDDIDPNIGLDEFGDILIGLNELPIIRGGFYDRNNNYYDTGIDFKSYSSVNIIIKESIPQDLSTKINYNNKIKLT